MAGQATDYPWSPPIISDSCTTTTRAIDRPDINDAMLKVGRDKLRDKGIVGNVEYVQANAEA